ncbi:hypothetical protein QBC37DRAFT_425757 [Rhypophila decipiens]|uniref:3beta-hydroxysteroid 3-dehydrogenase n=1 Tax=Rhypophila decipiens TaxID=261697 RepID=A0AAN6Y4D0_9PEZI|nr:hypothetical protein QBC37DRAFT_425757 [Rhypophila decipiens]
MSASRAGSILVTGANGGLGSAVVKQIASSPKLSAYCGLYTVRNAANAPALTAALQAPAASRSHKYDILSLDLTRLQHIRQLAEGINAGVSAGQIPPIRALILNAGWLDCGKQVFTEDGLDGVFAANYMGHWLLVLLLLQSMDKEAGRIIVLGSQSHDPHDPRNNSSGAFVDKQYKTVIHADSDIEAIAKGSWSTGITPKDASSLDAFRAGFRRYSAAKLFCIMMMHDLQRRLDQDAALMNISVLGVDPGLMPSSFTRQAPWIISVVLFKFVYPAIGWLYPSGSVRPTSRSAADVLEAAFGSPADGKASLKGLYLNDKLPFETSAESRDETEQRKLWAETVKLAGLKEGDTILRDWQ